MSTAALSAAAVLAKGLSTLQRLLDSKDEKVAMKAAELLLRWHTNTAKQKPTDDPDPVDEPDTTRESSLESGLQPVCPNEPTRAEARTPTKPASPANTAAKKLLLSPFNTPPVAPRANDPLSASFQDGSRPLTSFLSTAKAAAAPG